MRLRDHPAMIRRSGHVVWPPKWSTTRWDQDEKPMGEVGSLEDVVMSNIITDKIFLFILYRGYRYMGAITFDDPQFCRQLFELLKLNRGLSIKAIGDLDLSHLL